MLVMMYLLKLLISVFECVLCVFLYLLICVFLLFLYSQWRRFLLEIGGTSAEGASVERRRREDRGAEGAKGARVWGGGVPLPRKFFDF